MLKNFLRYGSALVLSSLAVACVALTDGTSSQCRSQEDCLARGPEFANTTCTTARVCEKIQVESQSCSTNRECLERNNGVPSLCRKSDGKCTQLLSAECGTFLGDQSVLTDDNTIFFGMTTLTNLNGVFNINGVALAVDEITRTTGGLPPVQPGGPRRPIVTVVCTSDAAQNGATLNDAIRQTQHLASIPVTGLFGPLSSASILEQLTQVVIPAGIPTMTTGVQVGVSNLADNDLVFRTVMNEDSSVGLLASWITNHAQPAALAAGVLLDGEPMRVAMALSNDNFGIGYNGLFTRSGVTFNGKDLQTNLAEGTFKLVDVGDIQDVIRQPDAYQKTASAIRQLQEYKPHVIIWAVPPQSAGALFGPANRTWPVGTEVPVQFWGSSGGNALAQAAMFALPAAVAEKLRTRFFVPFNLPVGFVQEDANTFDATLKLFRPELATSVIGDKAWAAYDAMYLFAYAIASLGPEPLTGANISKAVRKLGVGEVVKWGPTDLARGMALVTSGQTIDYHGVFGTYHFDANGDHPGSAELSCFNATTATPPRTLKRLGYAYNDASKSTTGAPPTACP